MIVKNKSILILSSFQGLYKAMDEEVVQNKEDLDLDLLNDAIASSSVKRRRSVLSTLRQQIAESSKYKDAFAMTKSDG